MRVQSPYSLFSRGGSHIFSLEKLLDLLSTFGDCSRLKLNVAKSEAMWLGKTANEKDMLFDVKWGHEDLFMHWGQLFHITVISVKQRISLAK